MMIETPYKNGDTVSFKLASGEEIVARLDEETSDAYKIKKPMVLIVQQDQSMGLAPFMFSVSQDAKFKVNARVVTCVLKTEKELASQYTQQTTGIAV